MSFSEEKRGMSFSEEKRGQQIPEFSLPTTHRVMKQFLGLLADYFLDHVENLVANYSKNTVRSRVDRAVDSYVL